ncbi:unnamed protein product [Symbiodinium microadriaticum]|nr:unnamed protein product [Symbiodinium microadriaticum]
MLSVAVLAIFDDNCCDGSFSEVPVRRACQAPCDNFALKEVRCDNETASCAFFAAFFCGRSKQESDLLAQVFPRKRGEQGGPFVSTQTSVADEEHLQDAREKQVRSRVLELQSRLMEVFYAWALQGIAMKAVSELAGGLSCEDTAQSTCSSKLWLLFWPDRPPPLFLRPWCPHKGDVRMGLPGWFVFGGEAAFFCQIYNAAAVELAKTCPVCLHALDDFNTVYAGAPLSDALVKYGNSTLNLLRVANATLRSQHVAAVMFNYSQDMRATSARVVQQWKHEP